MKKFLLATVLLVSMLSVACNRQNLKKQMERLVSAEVVIPAEIDRVYMGRDTIVVDDGNRAARLVVYIDSLSCSSCRLKYMFEYDDVLALHEETGGAFTPVFVFSPRPIQSAEVRNTLLYNRFEYPILLDDKGLFPAANPHIPADSRLHTFLLDRNGKVVMVGDPLNNPPLWELYKTAVTRLIDNGGVLPEMPELQ